MVISPKNDSPECIATWTCVKPKWYPLSLKRLGVVSSGVALSCLTIQYDYKKLSDHISGNLLFSYQITILYNSSNRLFHRVSTAECGDRVTSAWISMPFSNFCLHETCSEQLWVQDYIPHDTLLVLCLPRKRQSATYYTNKHECF